MASFESEFTRFEINSSTSVGNLKSIGSGNSVKTKHQIKSYYR
jgi:hypothetical protein